MNQKTKLKIGQRIEIICKNKLLTGKRGTITSIGTTEKLPIHITIDGENHETDFAEQELVVVEEHKLYSPNDDEIDGFLDIYGKGQMIDGQAHHQGTFTDRYGNQYPLFINILTQPKKVKQNEVSK